MTDKSHEILDGSGLSVKTLYNPERKPVGGRALGETYYERLQSHDHLIVIDQTRALEIPRQQIAQLTGISTFSILTESLDFSEKIRNFLNSRNLQQDYFTWSAEDPIIASGEDDEHKGKVCIVLKSQALVALQIALAEPKNLALPLSPEEKERLSQRIERILNRQETKRWAGYFDEEAQAYAPNNTEALAQRYAEVVAELYKTPDMVKSTLEQCRKQCICHEFDHLEQQEMFFMENDHRPEIVLNSLMRHVTELCGGDFVKRDMIESNQYNRFKDAFDRVNALAETKAAIVELSYTFHHLNLNLVIERFAALFHLFEVQEVIDPLTDKMLTRRVPIQEKLKNLNKYGKLYYDSHGVALLILLLQNPHLFIQFEDSPQKIDIRETAELIVSSLQEVIDHPQEFVAKIETPRLSESVNELLRISLDKLWAEYQNFLSFAKQRNSH